MVRQRPTTLSDDEQAQFDQHLSELFNELIDQVEHLLDEIDAEVLRELVYRLAFHPNDVLPKRQRRPSTRLAHLVDQVYQTHASKPVHRETLLQFAVIVYEYYDMLDDVGDGDVADGYVPHVAAATQTLMPLMIERLGRLGEDVLDYWTSRALRMVEGFCMELEAEPSLETYDTLLDRQSHYFGYGTGVAALAAEASDKEVERAERLGRCGYRYAQLVLDLEQREAGEDWNATRFLSDEEIIERMKKRRDEIESLTETYPDRRAGLVRAMFSVDLTRWEELD